MKSLFVVVALLSTSTSFADQTSCRTQLMSLLRDYNKFLNRVDVYVVNAVANGNWQKTTSSQITSASNAGLKVDATGLAISGEDLIQTQRQLSEDLQQKRSLIDSLEDSVLTCK